MTSPVPSYVTDSRSVRKELVLRAQEYYRKSLGKIVTFTQYTPTQTRRRTRSPIAPDLDQVLKMMLIDEIHGKEKTLPKADDMYSSEDVRKKFDGKRSIERQAGKLRYRLSTLPPSCRLPTVSKGTSRMLSASVELRKTPSPQLPASRYFPPSWKQVKDFAPILQARRSIETTLQKTAVTPAGKTSFAALSLHRAPRLAS